jgi:aspartate carbamoyltransferase regulatory subunit
MYIDSIKNGYVIDHIKAGQSMEIYKYLKLNELDCQVAIIQNAKSNKMGRKDIIKIDKDLKLDLDLLGYLDPNITVNVIKNDKLVEKIHPEMPERLVNIVNCKNPRCITSVERGLDQICVLTDRENRVYRCKYCESRTN